MGLQTYTKNYMLLRKACSSKVGLFQGRIQQQVIPCWIQPWSTHTGKIIWTEQFISTNICVYTYTYKHLITVKMESMNLKDSEGGFIGAYEGRKKKGEMWWWYYILKSNRQRILTVKQKLKCRLSIFSNHRKSFCCFSRINTVIAAVDVPCLLLWLKFCPKHTRGGKGLFQVTLHVTVHHRGKLGQEVKVGTEVETTESRSNWHSPGRTTNLVPLADFFC